MAQSMLLQKIRMSYGGMVFSRRRKRGRKVVSVSSAGDGLICKWDVFYFCMCTLKQETNMYNIPLRMEECRLRMLRYASSLPESPIAIIYFDMNSTPIYKEKVRVLTLPSGDYYFNTGPQGLWTYTYKVSDIEYIIHRHDTKVKAFVGKEFATFDGGRFDMASIGNHLSVGLKQHRQELRLSTHRTSYEEDYNEKDGYIFSVTRSLTYDIPFRDSFDRQEPLITNSEVRNGTIASAYAEHPYFLEAIERIHHVFQGTQQGGEDHFMYHGRKYKLHTANRGGKFILVNRKRMYVRSQKGGNTISDAVIQFMYDRFIHRVIQHFDADEFAHVDAKMLYDEEKGTHFVLCYDLTEIGQRRMYYLNIQEILSDYSDYTQQRNTQAIEQKYDMLASAHKQSLDVA